MSSPTETSPDPSNALKVAIMFVKQYYKCLSSHPDMLERFYSPGSDSYLSHGEGSEPTAPSPLSASNHGHDRWGCAENEKMMFEFEDGAIDAQPSQNEGILMVVTASVIFNGSGSVKTERRKTFVQTFFLAKSGRNFAVTNDILRFLTLPEAETPEELEEAVYVDANTGTDDELEVVEKTETAESTALVADEKKTDPMEDKATVTEDESSAPGGGVEETKEEAPEEDSTGSESKKRSSSKENKKKNKGAKQQQQPPPASKPAPGSWASLVVSGGSAPNTPSRAPEKKAPNNNVKASTKQPPLPPSDDKDNGETEKKSENNKATTTANGKANAKTDKQNNNNKQKDKERTKRDPDNTLVIKNLSENIKEQDILNMFQPFATATKAKIVGTNLNHHRLLAFVDYDSVAPVMAALKKHKETPFEWNGKVLEVDQKTLEQRARRKAGGNQNSNNPNNQNNNNNQNNGFRNAGAGRGGNNKYNNNQNGRGDGGRRRGTRAGR